MDILYWEWFKEKNSKGPWTKLELACRETWRNFSRLLLPGSPKYDWTEKYSMTSSKDMFFDAFQDIRNETSIAVYSLSCWPAIIALAEALKENLELSELIKSVLLIHPAKDPLHAVRIMDWIMRLWKWNINSRDYFLVNDPELSCRTLIDWWEWNWLQFQMDLNIGRNGEQFDWLVQKLETNFNTKITQLISPDDYVTNWKIPEVSWWKWALQTMSLHIPKQSWNELLKLCS